MYNWATDLIEDIMDYIETKDFEKLQTVILDKGVHTNNEMCVLIKPPKQNRYPHIKTLGSGSRLHRIDFIMSILYSVRGGRLHFNQTLYLF